MPNDRTPATGDHGELDEQGNSTDRLDDLGAGGSHPTTDGGGWLNTAGLLPRTGGHAASSPDLIFTAGRRHAASLSLVISPAASRVRSFALPDWSFAPHGRTCCVLARSHLHGRPAACCIPVPGDLSGCVQGRDAPEVSTKALTFPSISWILNPNCDATSQSRVRDGDMVEPLEDILRRRLSRDRWLLPLPAGICYQEVAKV